MEPSGRKLAGAVLLITLIIVWVVLVASLARFVGLLPVLVQAAFYLVMGVAWIFPARPLVRWIETGRFRAGTGDRN